jgi:hypothetical protein
VKRSRGIVIIIVVVNVVIIIIVVVAAVVVVVISNAIRSAVCIGITRRACTLVFLCTTRRRCATVAWRAGAS